jgi:hypothetical protein
MRQLEKPNNIQMEHRNAHFKYASTVLHSAVSFIYNLIKLYLTTVLLKMFHIPSTDILL